MKLPYKLIYQVIKEVTRFNNRKSNQNGRDTMIVSLMGKHIAIDFSLMNCNAPYNGILVREWILPMEVTISEDSSTSNSQIMAEYPKLEVIK